MTGINWPTFFKIANCWKRFWIQTNIFSLGKVVDFTFLLSRQSIELSFKRFACFMKILILTLQGNHLPWLLLVADIQNGVYGHGLWFMFHGYDMVSQLISVRTQYWHRNIDKMWCITFWTWFDKNNVNKITRKVTAVAGWNIGSSFRQTDQLHQII